MRLLLLALALAGCEVTPRYVENNDIDDAMAYSRYKTVCVGLTMKDEDTRAYATQKLAKVKEPIAAECICEHIGGKDDTWDPAIARGILGSDRDDIVGCFAERVARPDLPNREEAVVALANTSAPVSRTTLAQIAKEPGEDPARVRAVSSLGSNPEELETLLTLLTTATEAPIRAAAATGLHGSKKKDVVAALMTAAKGDASGDVRAAAMTSVRPSGGPEVRTLLCEAMMKDPEPAARAAAVRAFHGTTRDDEVACLRDRTMALEEDATVRQTLLEALKSSPRDTAALALCDGIAFWMKSYVGDKLPENQPDKDIIKAQNDRDWERSYQCVGKAYKSIGGATCYARAYTGWWYRELGGSAFIPKCPGLE